MRWCTSQFQHFIASAAKELSNYRPDSYSQCFVFETSTPAQPGTIWYIQESTFEVIGIRCSHITPIIILCFCHFFRTSFGKLKSLISRYLGSDFPISRPHFFWTDITTQILTCCQNWLNNPTVSVLPRITVNNLVLEIQNLLPLLSVEDVKFPVARLLLRCAVLHGRGGTKHDMVLGHDAATYLDEILFPHRDVTGWWWV